MSGLTTDFFLVAPWISGQVRCSVPHDGRVIGWVSGGEVVAGCMYESFTRVAITATIAIKHGITLPRRFLWAIVDYPFNQLRVNKVFSLVAANNKAALEFDRRIGYKQEAVLKDYFEDGDAYILSCHRDDCTWLRRLNYG